MKKRKVIEGINLPARASLSWYVVVGLLLDRLHISSFWMGIYVASSIGTLLLLGFLKYLSEEPVDIFKAIEEHKWPWKGGAN